MDERQTDTPEQVLKFAPKHKVDHSSPLDEAGKPF
jgi:hypothetical protein